MAAAKIMWTQIPFHSREGDAGPGVKRFDPTISQSPPQAPDLLALLCALC
jgi:hypothetical protein